MCLLKKPGEEKTQTHRIFLIKFIIYHFCLHFFLWIWVTIWCHFLSPILLQSFVFYCQIYHNSICYSPTIQFYRYHFMQLVERKKKCVITLSFIFTYIKLPTGLFVFSCRFKLLFVVTSFQFEELSLIVLIGQS